MSDANKLAVINYFKALGSGDAAAIESLVTSDVVVVTPGTAAICGTRNHDVMMQVVRAFPLITLSGIDFRIVHLTAEEARVACEIEGFATMVDGKAYNNQYHFLVFFRDGKICRIKEYLDTKLADEVLAPYLSR